MPRLKISTVLFGLSLVLAIAAGVSLYVYASNLQATVAVLQLNRPVEAGTPITKGLLGVAYVPAEAVPEDAIRSWDAIEGKAARGWIPEGTILRESLLLPKEQAKSPIEEVLGTNMVAMTVPLQVQSGGLLPSAGDRIMLYGLMAEQNSTVTVTRIGEAIRVLERLGPPPLTTPEPPAPPPDATTQAASGGGLVGGVTGGATTPPKNDEEVKPDTTVILVLEVSRDQAETIARHMVAGRLLAVLPNQDSLTAGGGLSSSAPAPEPSVPPAAPSMPSNAGGEAAAPAPEAGPSPNNQAPSPETPQTGGTLSS
ncbi:Flp pilus assembly protein CpaB [Thermaerobacter litoralis]